MLSRFDELINWSEISFKAKKSRSLSLVKGKAVVISFSVVNQMTPTVLEGPVKSLGCVCDESLTDKKAVQLIRETTENGMFSIERIRRLGKF